MSNDSSASRCYFYAGEEEYRRGKYEDALVFLLPAQLCAENDFERAMALNKIAWCWRYMGFKKIKDTSDCYQKAESYWRECLELLTSNEYRESREVKASAAKGLMLVVPLEEARVICRKYREYLLSYGDSDLELDLNNSWGIRLKDESPVEALGVFSHTYFSAMRCEKFVIAGHAAQNVGTIFLREYKEDLGRKENRLLRFNNTKAWFLKSLLAYPKDECAHIKSTVTKLRDLIEVSKKRGEQQLRILCINDSLNSDFDHLVFKKSDYIESNVPEDICRIAKLGANIYAIFENEV